MAVENGKSSQVRLFVAVDLPDGVRDGVAAWGQRELVDPALRIVPGANLHVTLAFLGWCAEEEVARAAAIVHGLEADAPEMAFAPEPVAVRWRGIASLYALEVASPDAAEIQSEVAERLVAAGLYQPEKRPFWPHITIARVRKETGGSRRYREVSGPLPELPEDLLGLFSGVRITLYRSKTRPQGAEYAPLAQLELPS
jgi:2'-5' RNA ligase